MPQRTRRHSHNHQGRENSQRKCPWLVSLKIRKAIERAVRAHVHHTHTEYDRLLSKGLDRMEGRSAVVRKVADVMQGWSRS